MATKMTMLHGRELYVDYPPEQPLRTFCSQASAAAFEQGLLTRAEARQAQWWAAVRPLNPQPRWRRT